MNMVFFKKHKIPTRIIIIFGALILIWGLINAYVRFKEDTADDFSVSLVNSLALGDPVREDSTKRCAVRSQGYVPVGYDCWYSIDVYYPGPPAINDLENRLNKSGLSITRVESIPNDDRSTMIWATSDNMRRSLEIDYRGDGVYPPSLRDKDIYKITAHEIIRVF